MAKNSRFFDNNNKIIHIYGYHSVKAALKNKNRKKKRLILSDNSSKYYTNDFGGYLKEIQEVKVLPKKKFDKTYSLEANNQGVILEAYNLRIKSIKEILNEENKNKRSILIMLDQLKDPQNIGSIMRSAAIFNCKSIILSKDNSPNMNSTIIKSASGGAEIVNYIQVTNLVRCIKEIKENNFWVIGLDSESKKTIDNFEIPDKCLFVLGSEHSGLRKLTKNNCDHIISIKSKNIANLEIDSLNVSNATSIVLYEHFKKKLIRLQKNKKCDINRTEPA